LRLLFVEAQISTSIIAFLNPRAAYHMTNSIELLLVENDPKDMKRAAELARAAGFTEIEAKQSPQAARRYLEDRLAERKRLPDAIVLDLDFGYESGYELLRFWHGHPELSSIPVIVWSVLGEEQREMCRLFKVKRFVGKWEENNVLEAALKEIRASN
jgi:CheY-like chemotaxis protein